MDSEQPISALSEMALPWFSPRVPGDGAGIEPGGMRRDMAAPLQQAQSPEALQGDRAFHAMLARLTGGISPVAMLMAYFDWAAHLAAAPERKLQIAGDALQRAGQL